MADSTCSAVAPSLTGKNWVTINLSRAVGVLEDSILARLREGISPDSILSTLPDMSYRPVDVNQGLWDFRIKGKDSIPVELSTVIKSCLNLRRRRHIRHAHSRDVRTHGTEY